MSDTAAQTFEVTSSPIAALVPGNASEGMTAEIVREPACCCGGLQDRGCEGCPTSPALRRLDARCDAGDSR